jgi:glycerol-3-phosphate dehydrogenase
MTDKILVTGGSSFGEALAKVLRDEVPDVEILLRPYGYIKYVEKVKVHSDNQSFIQQKMQGKRRIY